MFQKVVLKIEIIYHCYVMQISATCEQDSITKIIWSVAGCQCKVQEREVRPVSFTDFNFPFVFMDHEMFCVVVPREAGAGTPRRGFLPT